MASVDPQFAQWLQADADRAVGTDPATTARWGATAIATERVTGIATPADAHAEAQRQLAFFARGPFAVDVHQLVGTDWSEMLGRIVTLTIDRLGYDKGVDVMVIGVETTRATRISAVTVLCPLGRS